MQMPLAGFAENDEILSDEFITGLLRQISPFEGYNSGNSLNNGVYHVSTIRLVNNSFCHLFCTEHNFIFYIFGYF